MQYWDYHRVSEIENRKETNLKFWDKKQRAFSCSFCLWTWNTCDMAKQSTTYYFVEGIIEVLKKKEDDFASVCKLSSNPAIPFVLSIKIMH